MSNNLVNSQNYVPFIKPYVEGPTKEYKELQDRLIKDYDESAMMYDSLKEAADNMSSLNAEGDVALKKAAFDKAYKYIEEAAKMGDYENRGRLVRKAIKEFSTDYKPIAEQVAAKKQFYEDLDKRVAAGSLGSTEAAKLKRHVDDMYNEFGGLQRDPNTNNYRGYSNFTKVAPKTVDFIEKVNKAFSGIRETSIRQKWDEIVKQNGSDFEGMKKSINQAEEFIPQKTIQNIMRTVMNDPEVSDYLNFWTDVDSYKATPDDALKYIKQTITSEANRLLQKEPSKYKKYSEQQLLQESINSLKLNGYDAELITQAALADKSIARNIVKRGMINDKSNELFGFALDKYGAVKSIDDVSYNDIAGVESGYAAKQRFAKQSLDALSQPFLRKDATTFNVINDDNYKEIKNATIDDSMWQIAKVIGNMSDNATLGARQGAINVYKNAFKVTKEEEDKGITPLSKATKALYNKLATTKDPNKRLEIQSTINNLEEQDIKYQDLVRGQKELDEYLTSQLGKDYINYKKFLDDINSDKPKFSPLATKNDGNFTNNSNPVIFKPGEEYNSNTPLQIERLTKEFNEKKNKVGLIKTYSELGKTATEQDASKALINRLKNPEFLAANGEALKGTTIINNKLGEVVPVNQILKDIDLSKASIDSRYIKAPVVNGENGVLINITPSGTNTPIPVFIPSSSISNNALLSAAVNSSISKFDRLKDLAMAGTAREIKLPIINEVITVGDKKVDLSKKEYYIVFDENQRENYTLLDEEAYNKAKQK